VQHQAARGRQDITDVGVLRLVKSWAREGVEGVEELGRVRAGGGGEGG